MRTAPTCLAVMGMATAALAGSNTLIDQIGLDDGSSIDAANILANQYFEASFSVYDIGVVDDFDNSAGLAATSMQMVVGSVLQNPGSHLTKVFGTLPLVMAIVSAT